MSETSSTDKAPTTGEDSNKDNIPSPQILIDAEFIVIRFDTAWYIPQDTKGKNWRRIMPYAKSPINSLILNCYRPKEYQSPSDKEELPTCPYEKSLKFFMDNVKILNGSISSGDPKRIIRIELYLGETFDYEGDQCYQLFAELKKQTNLLIELIIYVSYPLQTKSLIKQYWIFFKNVTALYKEGEKMTNVISYQKRKVMFQDMAVPI